jgi:hypothetical protein
MMPGMNDYFSEINQNKDHYFNVQHATAIWDLSFIAKSILLFTLHKIKP